MSLETPDRDDRDWWEGKAARERRMAQFRPSRRLHILRTLYRFTFTPAFLLLTFVAVITSWIILTN